MDLSGIPQPTMDWNSSNLVDAWKKFKQHAELIFDGPMKGKEEDVMCRYLLLWIGDRGREIFNSWNVSNDDAKKLATYYTKYLAHVQPKLNPIFARYKFNNEVQGHRSTEEFVTQLRLLARDCSYTDVDDMIRDRLVFGTSSPQVREKLINQGEKLTLAKAIEISQSYEYAQAQLKSMNSQSNVEVNYVSNARHRIKTPLDQKQSSGSVRRDQPGKPRGKPPHKGSGRDRGSNTCDRCGRNHGKRDVCPAKGKQCDKCKKMNHFACVCRSTKVRVSEISAETESDFLDDFFIDSIDSKTKDGQIFATISVRGKPIRFKLDTGSQVNILPQSVYSKFGLAELSPLRKPERHLYAYNGNELNVAGECLLNCTFKGRDLPLNFYVVRTSSSPVLSLEACLDFDLIKLSYSVDSQTVTTQADKSLDKETILSEYSDLFSGIGELPGECNLRVDPNAVPVIHPPRRIPVTLRDKLKDELDRMEKIDVIAKVQEPTEWVNSIVVVEKPAYA